MNTHFSTNVLITASVSSTNLSISEFDLTDTKQFLAKRSPARDEVLASRLPGFDGSLAPFDPLVRLTLEFSRHKHKPIL
jgi:hypothetical protein